MTVLTKVASTAEVPEGTGKPFEIGSRVIAVFNLRGTFYAIENTCPHRGASLGWGTVDGQKVICPLHGWEFDIPTGRMWKSEGVATYSVKVVDDEIWVEL